MAVVLLCLEDLLLPWRCFHMLETQNSSVTSFSLNFFLPLPTVHFTLGLVQGPAGRRVWWEVAYTHGLTHAGLERPGQTAGLLAPSPLSNPMGRTKGSVSVDHHKECPLEGNHAAGRLVVEVASAFGSAPSQLSKQDSLRFCTFSKNCFIFDFST